MADTEIVTWLKENGANDEEIKRFVDDGFENSSEVGTEEIEEYIKRPGVKKRLVQKINERNKPKPKREPLPPPDLPPGATFDLSAPTLKNKDVEFKVPGGLSVEKGETPSHPSDLDNPHWMVIAKNASVLHGYRMDGAKPQRATEAACVWKVPAEDSGFYVDSEDEAGVSSEVTYTEAAASYVEQGIDREHATASYAFCSASFDRSAEHRQASSSSGSRLYMIGMWRYPRARLLLEQCSAVSPKFVAAVEDALTQTNKYAALNNVFLRFGHAMPREVLLGGQLTMVHEATTSAYASEQEAKSRMAGAVSIKAAGAEGTASVDVEKASKSTKEQLAIAESTRFKATGGDTLLTSAPDKWAPTVNHPNEWAVIEKTDLRSTIDLLPTGLQTQVRGVWPGAPKAPGERVAAPIDRAVTAESDGFVSLTALTNGDKSNAWFIHYLVGIRELVGTTNSYQADQAKRYNAGSYLCPIPRDEAYQIIGKVEYGNSAVLAHWQPFELGFGGRQALADTRYGTQYPILDEKYAAKEFTAEDDGLVIFTMKSKTQDRAFCSFFGEHEVKGRFETWMKGGMQCGRGWSKEIWLWYQSFCMPVRKGCKYRFVADRRELHAQYDATIDYLPMRGHYRFGEPREVRADAPAAQADRHGILFGYIDSTGLDSCGWGALRVNSDPAKLDDLMSPQAATSVHDWGADRLVHHGSMTAVVRKGDYYRAALFSFNGVQNGTFRFIPLEVQ